jgi:hypothetical protein
VEVTLVEKGVGIRPKRRSYVGLNEPGLRGLPMRCSDLTRGTCSGPGNDQDAGPKQPAPENSKKATAKPAPQTRCMWGGGISVCSACNKSITVPIPPRHQMLRDVIGMNGKALGPGCRPGGTGARLSRLRSPTGPSRWKPGGFTEKEKNEPASLLSMIRSTDAVRCIAVRPFDCRRDSEQARPATP